MSQIVCFQASIYFDDGNCPIAGEGPSKDFTTLEKAKAWATQQVATYSHAGNVLDDGFWYGVILRGRYVDPIGDGLLFDFTFESDPEFSEIVQ